MLAMCDKNSDLWYYIDRHMTFVDIEMFVITHGGPVVYLSLYNWRRKFADHCSCAVYTTYRGLGYRLYFPSNKHKAKFLLMFGPFVN